jgi:hypothetical protein
MVNTLGSIAPTPSREAVVDVLQLGGSRSQTFGNASHGAL